MLLCFHGMRIFPVILTFCILMSCENRSKVLNKEVYEGPAVEMTNIDVLISDSTIVKLRLVAPKQLVLQNNDRDFPEGIYIEFFSDLGIMTATLEANTGYYYSEEDYYKAEGNVIWRKKNSNNELTSELLNWVPSEERIHTDHFVTIVSGNEVHTGEGLEATQDFETYTILKPSGTMELDDSGEMVDSEGFDEELEFVEDTTTIE